jgi:hypothetical protein
MMPTVRLDRRARFGHACTIRHAGLIHYAAHRTFAASEGQAMKSREPDKQPTCLGTVVPKGDANVPGRSKRPLCISIVFMSLGVGWLLTSLGFGPGINWVWTIGLGAMGLLAIIISGGVDKFSVVVGPFFVAASVLSIMRQNGQIQADIELPILVIGIGALLFVAQTRMIPTPNWFGPPATMLD